jgi:hypothetical protein
MGGVNTLEAQFFLQSETTGLFTAPISSGIRRERAVPVGTHDITLYIKNIK